MGLAGLLRAWRKAAGARRGRPLTQPEVAEAVGRGERWYRDLERGATTRPLNREQCEALAQVLQLSEDERHALLLHNIGGSLDASVPSGDPRVRRALRLLIDKQMPSPTYLCDSNWNILAYNQAMAEWWPWVIEPGANLMRWALLSPEARVQYHDWHQHAKAYVRLLKFAQASNRDNAELMQLINDVRKDPDVRHIWETCNEFAKNRDGHVFRMSLPAMNWETVEVVSHLLYPASLPDCRLVVITWLQGDDDDERDSLGGERNGWAASPSENDKQVDRGGAASRRRIAHNLTKRLSVPSAKDAAALAGDDRVDLPILSQMIGENCQLTLSPSTHSVIWATKEEDGDWGIAEVDAYTMIVRMPQAASVEAAYEELKALMRAVLPADPKDAVARIQVLATQWDQRMKLLQAIHRDLWQADKTLPYIWHPVDEI
ncbi:helix-turn-helix transcriptional regulator [Streptomyces sp. NBC_00133]|uniref:helix-turn-helix transcriptional regulator n=1 Tax=Streptomyces sp. NBC_00133 TaxID=2903624 RepID=UPI00386DB03A